jgi:Nuclease-related domain
MDEVDLLVLGRRRLHLVELKYYSGTLRGDDLTWRRDCHRAEDSPLKLARRKAQRLASKLQDALIRWAGLIDEDPLGEGDGLAQQHSGTRHLVLVELVDKVTQFLTRHGHHARLRVHPRGSGGVARQRQQTASPVLCR